MRIIRYIIANTWKSATKYRVPCGWRRLLSLIAAKVKVSFRVWTSYAQYFPFLQAKQMRGYVYVGANDHFWNFNSEGRSWLTVKIVTLVSFYLVSHPPISEYVHSQSFIDPSMSSLLPISLDFANDFPKTFELDGSTDQRLALHILVYHKIA